MSLDDSWAGELGDVPLTYLYRICNRAIIMTQADEPGSLETKGEQDIAWAVKKEYERRRAAGGNVF